MLIKIKTWFEDDVPIIVDSEELHKIQWLFLHPEARTILADGTPLIGKNIKDFRPAYHEIMGWNPSHHLTGEDWNDIRQKGIDKEYQEVKMLALQITNKIKDNPVYLQKNISEIKPLLLK